MQFIYRSVMVSVMLCGAGVSLGCANDTTGPAPLDPAHLYYQLTLNHHAITMALASPYDTLQLVATPYAATGALLADSGGSIWTTSDTSVRVSPTGLLTASTPVAGVLVIARRTMGALTRADTAIVNVNDTASVPHFATLTLQPNPTLFGIPYYDLEGIIQFIPSALDPQGDTIPNVVFRVTSATPQILVSSNSFGTSSFARVSAGQARLVTEATVYGVRKVDTLPFTVGWWQHVVVDIHPRYAAGSQLPTGYFAPPEDTVAVGGSVIWRNDLPGQAVDVVFDDPTAALAVDSATFLSGFASALGLVIPQQGGGNIPAFAPLDTGSLQGQDTLGVRARRFPTAGTYPYHSTLYGTGGVIHVLPEFQVP